MDNLPEVFTTKTLAAYWSCSPSHIKNLLVARDLKGFKLGGRLWRIRKSEVLEWEEKQLRLEGSGSNDIGDNSTPSDLMKMDALSDQSAGRALRSV